MPAVQPPLADHDSSRHDEPRELPFVRDLFADGGRVPWVRDRLGVDR